MFIKITDSEGFMYTWANPSLQGWIWKCYKGMFCKYTSIVFGVHSIPIHLIFRTLKIFSNVSPISSIQLVIVYLAFVTLSMICIFLEYTVIRRDCKKTRWYRKLQNLYCKFLQLSSLFFGNKQYTIAISLIWPLRHVFRILVLTIG